VKIRRVAAGISVAAHGRVNRTPILLSLALLFACTAGSAVDEDPLARTIGGGSQCFGKQDLDAFGSSIVAGDFDGDGDVDLAVAAPTDSDGVLGSVGAVYVFRRDAAWYVPWTRITSRTLGLPTTTATRFAGTLAVGDFDRDGRAELAIARTGPNANGIFPGDVAIVGLGKLGFTLQQVLTQAGLGTDAPGDRFGATLAAGDFDGDGAPDLAVGAPSDIEGLGTRQGIVYVFRATVGALAPWLTRTPLAWGTAAEPGGSFGAALAAGDFDGNGTMDLAIGAPTETIAQGAVSLYLAVGTTPLVPRSRWEGRLVVAPSTTSSTGFGSILATGDLDGDGKDDVAIGAPLAKLGTDLEVGAVVLLHGGGYSATSWTNLAMPFPGANQGRWLASGDFDGNGTADLAVGQDRYGSIGELMVWRGRAGTSPALGDTYAETQLVGAAAYDLDGDGKSELLVGTKDAPVLIGGGRSLYMPALDHKLYEQQPACEPYWGLPPAISLVRARPHSLVVQATTSATIDQLRLRRVNGSLTTSTTSPVERTDGELSPGTSYCYAAASLLADSDAYSDEVQTCFSTAPPIPGPAVSLVDRTVSSLVVWIGANVGGSQLRSQLDGDPSTARTDSVTGLTRTFSSLSANTNYCVTAAEFHADVDEWSSDTHACFATLPAVETGTTVVTLYPQPIEGPGVYAGHWGPLNGAHPVRLWVVDSAVDYTIQFVKPGFSNADCGNPAAVVELHDGGSLGPAEIEAIFGGTPVTDAAFLACRVGSLPQPDSVLFNLDWER
jgi:hypothetical protein